MVVEAVIGHPLAVVPPHPGTYTHTHKKNHTYPPKFNDIKTLAAPHIYAIVADIYAIAD